MREFYRALITRQRAEKLQKELVERRNRDYSPATLQEVEDEIERKKQQQQEFDNLMNANNIQGKEGDA